MQCRQGYGQVAGNQMRERRRKNRMAVMGISSVVLVAMVVGVAVSVGRNRNGGAGSDDDGYDRMNESMKPIVAICQPTDFKDSCVNTLKEAAGGNTTDPQQLMELVFRVTIQHLREIFNHSEVLRATTDDPRTGHALENCQELLDYAVDDITNSMKQLSPFNASKLVKAIHDVKIWLSAAITYEETCLDGFETTAGDAGESMRKAMNLSMELTRNALAIVDDASAVLDDFKVPSLQRKLLAKGPPVAPIGGGGFPEWADARQRRVLEAGPDQEVKPNMTVAQDGSGDYKTINEALLAIDKKKSDSFVLYIKQGVYKETVWIDGNQTNLMLVGDGPDKTTITGSLNVVDGTPTFKTATVAVSATGFIAKGIRFENTAGPEKHQAVALRVGADKALFYNCRMDAYQDTLYVHAKRQFYTNCTVSGTVDFIFGDAAVVFQNCLILVRKPMAQQKNIVTAQGRKDVREPTGIVIHNSTIAADADYYPERTRLPSYLGRPWKEFSRTFVVQSDIGDLIQPDGWLPWVGDFALDTCYYAEFDNRGAGAPTGKRVTWKGIKKIGAEEARLYTADAFLQGREWIEPTGITYVPDLLLPLSTASQETGINNNLQRMAPSQSPAPSYTPTKEARGNNDTAN